MKINKRISSALFACVFAVFAVVAIPNQADAASYYNYNNTVSASYCQTGFCGSVYYNEGYNNNNTYSRTNGVDVSYQYYYQQPQQQYVYYYTYQPAQAYTYSYSNPYYYYYSVPQQQYYNHTHVQKYDVKKDFNSAYDKVMNELNY